MYCPSKVCRIAVVCCILGGIALCKLLLTLIVVGISALLFDLHDSFSEYSCVFPEERALAVCISEDAL